MEQANTTDEAIPIEKANITEKAKVTKVVNHITMHPSDLLRSVAASMNWNDTEIFVTVPMMTTWKTILRATDAALGEVDRGFKVTYPRTEAQKLRSRQIALENVAAEASSSGQPFACTSNTYKIRYYVSSFPEAYI
jgi:hypothetical protein